MPSLESDPMDAVRALREAVRRDDRARVSALLEADPTLSSAGNPRGVALLVDARLRGHAALVARLAAARRAPGQPPLTADELIALGDAPALAQRLARHPGAADVAAADGFLPLHRAAHLGEAAAVEALLAAGADPEHAATNASGNTAAASARCGRRPALAVRLERGELARA